MNKLEEFTEGSEWMSASGCKLKVHSIDKQERVVFFTCNKEHPFLEQNGTISFLHGWKIFKKVDK